MKHVREIARNVSKSAQELATGDKYYVIQEQIEAEILDRVESFQGNSSNGRQH